MAKGRGLCGRTENVIAFIGDGSMSGGEAFEGLDNAGEMNTNLIIIFNDNEMSIAPNHGGIYKGARRTARHQRRIRAQPVPRLRTRLPVCGGRPVRRCRHRRTACGGRDLGYRQGRGKPVYEVASTFLRRAYGQLQQDLALQGNAATIITAGFGDAIGPGERIAAYYDSSDMKVLTYGAHKELTDREPTETLYARYRLNREQIVQDVLEVLR